MYAARFALRGLGALRTVVFRLGTVFSYTERAFSPVQRVVTRWIALPLYRISFFLQLRFRKTVASTRGLLFLLFTSRYTLHILLAALAVPIAFTQLQPASAAAEVGQHSILYALVTNGQESITKETADELSATSVSYLDETVQPLVRIDFDYEMSDMDERTTDYGVPGTLALRPHPTNLETPSADIPTTPEPVIAEAPPEEPAARSTEVRSYTVRSGDTLAVIARRNGITVGTILWANNLTSKSPLRPGDTLKILPVSGVLHTVKRGDTLAAVAQQYGVSAQAIRDANDGTTKLALGAALIIPGGEPLPTKTVVAVKPPVEKPSITVPAPVTPAPKPAAPGTKTPKVTSAKGVRADVPIARIKNKAFDIYQELSSSANDTRETPAEIDETVPESKTKLLWPTKRHVINQYYGWNHTGVDLDGDYTDPIYASEDGTVTTASWNSGGYGLQIVIDHEGGLRTRYAHSSKIFVKVGDAVKRGQVIGYVGTTGRSTGTHLHFEVYANGVRKNPLAYIK